MVLHVTPGNTAVMCNGRVVTPLARASPEDLQLIETLEISSGAGKKTITSPSGIRKLKKLR